MTEGETRKRLDKLEAERKIGRFFENVFIYLLCVFFFAVCVLIPPVAIRLCRTWIKWLDKEKGREEGA